MSGMKRKWMSGLVGVSAAAMVLGAGASASGNVIFEDDFPGDSLGAHWTHGDAISSTHGSAEVSGGRLAIRSDETGEGGSNRRESVYTDVDPMFNFFQTPLRLSVYDLEIQSSDDQGHHNIAFSSDPTDIMGRAEANGGGNVFLIKLREDQDRLRIDSQLNATSDHSWTSYVSTTAVTVQDIVNVHMDLDATHFEVTLDYADGSSSSWADEHGLTASAWGNDGDSAVHFEVEQRGDGSWAEMSFSRVEVIPEPGTVGLLAAGLGLMGIRPRRRK